MPRRRDGVSREGAQRGDRRRELADVVQVGVEALDRPGAGDGQAAVVEGDLCAHPDEQVAQRVAGLGGPPRPSGHADPAAAGHRQHHEGRGVRQVRLDRHVDGPDACGRHRPGGRRRTSTSTPCSAGTATVISMWGSEGTGGPSWRTLTPSSYAAPASSSAETNWLDAEASMTTCPPRDVSGPGHGERQRAPAAVVDLHAERRAGRRGHRPSGGSGRAGHRRTRRCRSRGPPPAGRSASPCRPGHSRRRRRAAGRGSPTSPVRRCRPASPAWSGPRPSARCRATAAPGVRRTGRRPAPPAPARGWSATSSPGARPARRPERAPPAPATGRVVPPGASPRPRG